jgi:hypothetical protein
VSVQHHVVLSPQPTDMSCWSAATSMLFGSVFSAGPGRASLGATGGLRSHFSNVQEFAESWGLRMHAPQSWTAEAFAELVSDGPVVMMGALPNMHAVVIGGVVSDGTAEGTTLTIYDPWPPGRGSVYSVNYETMMQRFPFSTMYLLQRPAAARW